MTISRYAQLLVHIDTGPRNVRRLTYAHAIAVQQESAVTALYAVTPAMLDLAFGPDAGGVVAEALADIDKQRRDHAHADFLAAMKSCRWPEGRIAWAEGSQWPSTIEFAQRALYADLLVLEQQDADVAEVPVDFVENVLQSSGRPAIVLPASEIPYTPPSTIAIAWKPTRESARAITAAMPLLQRARQVHVIEWGEHDQAAGDGLSLDSYLRAHGVQFTWHREGPPDKAAEVGDLLLSRTCDLGADLLVMGCYGHHRATEWVLGGVSRTVLRSMTLPVLMAH